MINVYFSCNFSFKVYNTDWVIPSLCETVYFQKFESVFLMRIIQGAAGRYRRCGRYGDRKYNRGGISLEGTRVPGREIGVGGSQSRGSVGAKYLTRAGTAGGYF